MLLSDRACSIRKNVHLPQFSMVKLPHRTAAGSVGNNGMKWGGRRALSENRRRRGSEFGAPFSGAVLDQQAGWDGEPYGRSQRRVMIGVFKSVHQPLRGPLR